MMFWYKIVLCVCVFVCGLNSDWFMDDFGMLVYGIKLCYSRKVINVFILFEFIF